MLWALLVTEVCGHDESPGEVPVTPRHGQPFHVRTQIVASTLAEGTHPTRCGRLHSDPVSCLKKRKGLFRCKVFLYRAYIFEQSSLDEMKGIR